VDTVATAAADMFSQLRAASSAAHGTISAPDLLAAATIGGAEVLGLADRIGSLRPGKQADLQLLRRDAPGMWPSADPVPTIVTSADRGVVDTVFVAGRIVKSHGALTAHGLDRVAELLRESAARLSAG
ncbi:MAG: amidohydrolase family protein, partial [Stackebrandtia sp.]